jgi:hypothetical protein
MALQAFVYIWEKLSGNLVNWAELNMLISNLDKLFIIVAEIVLLYTGYKIFVFGTNKISEIETEKEKGTHPPQNAAMHTFVTTTTNVNVKETRTINEKEKTDIATKNTEEKTTTERKETNPDVEKETGSSMGFEYTNRTTLKFACVGGLVIIGIALLILIVSVLKVAWSTVEPNNIVIDTISVAQDSTVLPMILAPTQPDSLPQSIE